MSAATDDRPTLRELEILRAMIGGGKTVAAARLLGLSQPAVSRGLATLEGKFGRTLFVRDGARLAPTAAALELEREASGILDAVDRLASRRSAPAAARILIATAPTMAQFVLPEAIAAYRALEPDVSIEIDIGKGADALAAVADHHADLGLVDAPATHPAIRQEVIRESIAHAIVPERHRLAALPRVTAADLAGEPFVALARRFPSRIEFDRAFEAAHVPHRIVAEVTTSTFAVQLVRAGVGLALLNPFPLSLGGLDGLRAVPFEPRVTYRTCLLFAAGGVLNPAARRFADFLKARLPEDGPALPLQPPG